jgi:hypothetical protein
MQGKKGLVLAQVAGLGGLERVVQQLQGLMMSPISTTDKSIGNMRSSRAGGHEELKSTDLSPIPV